MKAGARQQGAAVAAVVAGAALGCALAAAVLCGVTYAGWKRADILNEPALKELSAASRRAPRDEALKERVRDLDLRLRADYFIALRRVRATGLLAIGALAVLAAALAARRSLLRSLAAPASCPGPNPEFLGARLALRLLAWGAALAALALTGVGLTRPGLLLDAVEAPAGAAAAPRAGPEGGAGR